MGTSKSAKARKHAVPTKTGEFTILPLTLPTQPGLPPACAEAKHYLYIRVHAPTNPTPDTDRSLFIANVPIDASESNIRRLFAEQLGGARVESVEFDSAIPAGPVRKQVREEVVAEKGKGRKRKRDEEVVAEGLVEDEESALPRIWPAPLRKSGSTAVVVFVDRESRRGALKEVQRVVKEGTEVRWLGGEKGVVGVERYKSHLALRYPQPTQLLATTTAYLAQFDAVVQSRDRLLAHSRAVPDEDGFITVTRGGGRTAPAARIEQAEQKKAELEARRKKNGVKDDFYRFQNRERRKEEEMKLKREFERDRKRVAEMRERRGVVRPE